MQHAARGYAARRDVSGAADHRVIRGQDFAKELFVHVVETGALLANPTLGDESPGENRQLSLGVRKRVAIAPLLLDGARDEHPVAGLYLLEQLPEQQRDSGHVDETEDRMIVGARKLVTVIGSKAERRVIAGVEQLRSVNRAAEAVENIEVDGVIRIGLSVRHQ